MVELSACLQSRGEHACKVRLVFAQSGPDSDNTLQTGPQMYLVRATFLFGAESWLSAGLRPRQLSRSDHVAAGKRKVTLQGAHANRLAPNNWHVELPGTSQG